MTRLLIVLATAFVLCCGNALATSTVRWSPWQAEKRLVRGDIRWDDGVKWYVTQANCGGIGHASVGTNGGRRYARFRCHILAYESLEAGYSVAVLLTPISRTRYKVRREFGEFPRTGHRTGHQATPN